MLHPEELYRWNDLGVVVNESNQAVDTYQRSEKIEVRKAGWHRFSLDVDLLNSKLRVKARASASSAGHKNATTAYFDVVEITVSGYCEVSTPTSAYDLELEWETTDAVNTTKVAFMVTRG
jgi:hypothetical protein